MAEIYRALWEYNLTRIQSALDNRSLSVFAKQIAVLRTVLVVYETSHIWTDFVPTSLRWFFAQRGFRFHPVGKAASANQPAPELTGRIPRLAANESGKRGRIGKTKIACDLGEVLSRVPHPFDGRMQPVIA